MNSIKKHITNFCMEYYFPTMIIFITSLIVLYNQLTNKTMIISSDTIVHYGQFFDIYQQLITTHYNYFQTNFSFNQCGRIINTVYGPIFTFLNALLLFNCKTWHRYQILSDFLINLVGGLGFYTLARKANSNKYISSALIPIFLVTGSMPLWINGTSFMGCSAAITPWVLIQA